MNVLPLIFSIIISLFLSFSLIVHNTTYHQQLENSFLSYSKSLKKIQDCLQERSYKKIPKMKEKKDFPKPVNQSSERKKEPPLKKPPLKEEEVPFCAKLDLSNQSLKKFSKKLFLKKYALFFEKTSFTADRFFEELFEKLQKQKIDLSKISWKNHEKQKIYYQLLNGVVFFTNNKPRSLPSIEKYFKNDPTHPKICFQCMNSELLTLFFSKEVTEEIYRTRNPKRRLLLKKQDLLPLLLQENTSFQDWHLLSFQHKQDHNYFLGFDQDIQVRRSYSNSP